jgi:hypothetical protein
LRTLKEGFFSMFKSKMLTLILSALAPSFSTAFADSAKAMLKIDVEVESNAAAAPELVGCFDRALKKIEGVEMTKESPDIVIHCSFEPVKLESGTLLGYVIGAAFTSSMSLRLPPGFSGLNSAQAARMIARTKGDEIYCAMTTSVVGPTPEAVEREVKRIVESADGEIFQAEREQLQMTGAWPNSNAQAQGSSKN